MRMLTAIRGKNDDEINKLKKELAALAKIGQSKKLLDQNEACNIACCPTATQRTKEQRALRNHACKPARTCNGTALRRRA